MFKKKRYYDIRSQEAKRNRSINLGNKIEANNLIDESSTEYALQVITFVYFEI